MKSNRIGNHYRDQLPYFHDEPLPDRDPTPPADDDGILEIAPTPHGVCPGCLGALELFEGEIYCPDCTAFGLADEATADAQALDLAS
ncbi:MAG TPA: hypothetical protein VEL76_16405 [Gemmataceae bacterium]|nr:hypothetical protein [Gemmataceae bacterium]